MKLFYCLLSVILLSIISCENQNRKAERLARQSCGSCHAFPQPSLLDKKSWKEKVLPEMAFRMGLDNTPLSTINFEDQSAILRSLPARPMISNSSWNLIQNYYINNAPDSLPNPEQIVEDTLSTFEAVPLRLKMSHHQTVTLIEHDSVRNRIYIGNRPGSLYEFNMKFNPTDSMQLASAPSKIIIDPGGDLLILQMGIMDPNEQPKGTLTTLQRKEKIFKPLLDSLQRPVDFLHADIDNDGATDYVVCNFGNYTGSLMAFQGLPHGRFRKYILQALPGARRVVLKDLDGNGMIDILALMAQGDERIVAFYNRGNFQFRMSTLLRFDAVYGSSYFEVADFNNDGKFDILHTSGDNADYSPVLKPYHGVRLFLNTGTNEFKENWFYPMHGASQARVADFDQDGDLDIAAISFFPDFNNHPEQGFTYLENTGNSFKPSITPIGAKGRWITMEVADVDADGDSDLLLGSLAFPVQVPAKLIEEWRNDQLDVLLLRNTLR